MPGTNEQGQDFQFSMNCVKVNADLMIVYVNQGKNGIMMNVQLRVKYQMIGALVQIIVARKGGRDC